MKKPSLIFLLAMLLLLITLMQVARPQTPVNFSSPLESGK
jgi:hypothetical protein